MTPRRTKRWLLQPWLWALAAVLLADHLGVGWLCSTMQPYLDPAKQETMFAHAQVRKARKSDRPVVLLIGSSVIRTNVDTELLAELLGGDVECDCVAINGADAASLLCFEYWLLDTRPAVCVVQTFTAYFQEELRWGAINRVTSPSFLELLTHDPDEYSLPFLRDSRHVADALLGIVFPSYRLRDDLRKDTFENLVSLMLRRSFVPPGAEPRDPDKVNIKVARRLAARRKQLAGPPSPYTDLQWFACGRVLDLLKQRSDQVLTYDPPLHPVWDEFERGLGESNMTRLRPMLAEKGIALLAPRETLGLDENDFMDSVHLSPAGTEKQTRQLAETIRPMLQNMGTSGTGRIQP